MTTDADFDVLRREGVSEAGINFVAQLLNRNPHDRPKERECLRHRWIADVEDVDKYEDEAVFSGAELLSDIGEDLEDELDASQLSLNDNVDAEDADEEGSDLAQSKRPRIDNPPADIRYPSLPNIESFKEFQAGADATPKRLFGEINPSALQSSHALGDDAAEFESDGNFSIHDFISSAGESIISGGMSLNSVLSLPDNPVAGSAPSLMGTENLVGQLNMNSTWHPGTSTNLPPVTGAPGRQANDETVPKNVSVPQQAVPGGDTPKASKFSRRIELPIPDTASERSSSSPDTTAQETKNKPSGSQAASDGIFDIELANTMDAQTGQPLPDPRDRTDSDLLIEPVPEHALTGIPRIVIQPHQPQPLLGKLTTLSGSIFDLTIRLEDRLTSWGRGPQATICHPDPMDTRIPAYALEVTFWAPAIESRIAAGESWMSVPNVMAILSTKTRKCIWVNGTELRRGPEGNDGRQGFHFGKLYTGDIITVYQHRNKFLRFECEFYHGDSARRRPEDENGFTVRKVLMPKDIAANQLPGRKERHEKK
ncbi:hypothetical protein EYZ11_005859 [Aspergillus tanneri]|nr:hypothetical protein EYZ11_005859 [Aspergillus tanneri]